MIGITKFRDCPFEYASPNCQLAKQSEIWLLPTIISIFGFAHHFLKLEAYCLKMKNLPN